MLNISIRQLHYFLALAQTGSFSGAAKRVGITQSTLSAAIQALETELDTVLIDRSGRHMRLLPAGEELVNRARDIIALVQDLPAHVARADRPLSTRLRLGVIPSIAPFLLPKILSSTAEAYPDLHLVVREGLTRTLLEAMRGGTLDAALIAQPYQLEDFEFEPIGQDPFYLAIKPDNPLANRAEVDAEDLRTQSVLLLEAGHCLREHVIAALGSSPAIEASDVHATSIMTLVQMVDFGMGVTLLPEIAIRAGATRGTDIRLIPYSGAFNSRALALAWRAGAARRAEYVLFAAHLAAAFRMDEQTW